MYLFCSALPNGGEGAIYDPQKSVWSFFSVAKGESFIDVISKNYEVENMTHMTVINGPGPFLMLRSIVVMANTWKNFSPHKGVLSSCSTAVFLQYRFPDAEIVIMSAGKKNVLLAQKKSIEMVKKPLEEVLPLLAQKKWGGILMDGVEKNISADVVQNRVLEIPQEQYWEAVLKSVQKCENITVQYAQGDEWDGIMKSSE